MRIDKISKIDERVLILLKEKVKEIFCLGMIKDKINNYETTYRKDLINWDLITKWYNQDFNTNYDTETLLKTLYQETKSSHTMGDKILGVSAPMILDKLREFNEPIQRRGGDYQRRARKKNALLNIPDEQLKEMNIHDIVEITHSSKAWAYVILKENNKEYKRL